MLTYNEYNEDEGTYCQISNIAEHGVRILLGDVRWDMYTLDEVRKFAQALSEAATAAEMEFGELDFVEV